MTQGGEGGGEATIQQVVLHRDAEVLTVKILLKCTPTEKTLTQDKTMRIVIIVLYIILCSCTVLHDSVSARSSHFTLTREYM